MEVAKTLMWYENSILMSFLGVTLGAIIGFVGSIIQSKISAKNNIDVIKAQSENELKQHRYMEKEKLYSELIEFVPHYSFTVDVSARKSYLSRERKIQLNSFKARLSIFSNQKIYDEFYNLIVYIGEETDDKKVVSRIDVFTEMLLKDLKQ